MREKREKRSKSKDSKRKRRDEENDKMSKRARGQAAVALGIVLLVFVILLLAQMCQNNTVNRPPIQAAPYQPRTPEEQRTDFICSVIGMLLGVGLLVGILALIIWSCRQPFCLD